jgi:hypothetical protein
MKYYDVTNASLKKEVLTYFFDRINYYEYRYIMLKTLDDFKKNEKNIEYVIPQIKGEPCFLIFCTLNNQKSLDKPDDKSINRKGQSFLIEKRKLKFNLDSCDLSEIKIYSVNYKSTNNKTHICSIFDCRIVNQNNTSIVLIQDCYYLDGIKMNAMKIERKMNHIDDYISRYLKDTNLKIRKVNQIKDIIELDKKISLAIVEINGFIFLQGRSGVSYIFVDSENFSKNSNTNNVEQILDSNINKFNASFNDSELVFLLKKDAKPDVYHIYDKENNLIHFASIPNTQISQMCYDALKNTDSAYFKCEMDQRWKRYKPVQLISA